MLRLFKQYYPIRNLFFVIGEGGLIYLSIHSASRMIVGADVMQAEIWVSLKILLVAVVCQTSLYYFDLYDLAVTDSIPELCVRLMQALGTAAIFLAAVYLVLPMMIIGHGVFAIGIAMVIMFIVSWRLCYAAILSKGLFDQNIVILGTDDFAIKIIDEIERRADSGYTIAYAVSNCEQDVLINPRTGSRTICRKGYENLARMVDEAGIGIVVVALADLRAHFPTKQLLQCRVNGVDIFDGATFYEMLTGKLLVEQIKPSWLIFSDGFRKSPLRRFVKRVIDLGLSLSLLMLLSPLIMLTAFFIKLESSGPTLFSQDRVGQDKHDYRMHKFRSMVKDAEKHCGPVWARTDDDRITRVGRFIRKTRIDELPQLWNVLRGEMSLVGPRPERAFFVRQLEEIIPYYRERFVVKPGVTGWAQVSYGYGATVEDAIEKLNYDLFYIKNMSIFMDLMIVAKTVKIVLFGKGAR